jgi:hypothetical protein
MFGGRHNANRRQRIIILLIQLGLYQNNPVRFVGILLILQKGRLESRGESQRGTPYAGDRRA